MQDVSMNDVIGELDAENKASQPEAKSEDKKEETKEEAPETKVPEEESEAEADAKEKDGDDKENPEGKKKTFSKEEALVYKLNREKDKRKTVETALNAKINDLEAKINSLLDSKTSKSVQENLEGIDEMVAEYKKEAGIDGEIDVGFISKLASYIEKNALAKAKGLLEEELKEVRESKIAKETELKVDKAFKEDLAEFVTDDEQPEEYRDFAASDPEKFKEFVRKFPAKTEFAEIAELFFLKFGSPKGKKKPSMMPEGRNGVTVQKKQIKTDKDLLEASDEDAMATLKSLGFNMGRGN